jgi:hypothetical protein
MLAKLARGALQIVAKALTIFSAPKFKTNAALVRLVD